MTAEQRARKDTVEASEASAVYPPRPVVLAIDDEPGVRESLRLILGEEFEVLEAADGAAALAILGARRVDVALLDVRMPGEPGSRVLPQILAIDDSIPVILITADPHLRMAVDAMKAGAYDYLAKPFDVDEILSLVREAAQQRGMERELHYLRGELARAHGFDQLVGRHPRMVRLYELIAQVSQTHATVLITAESGTGKELVARAIHNQSPRRAQPFVAVNLAAIPDSLLESELFGHEKGAFTGAHARKPGKFELAHGGTLFLDEVGSLRVDLQAKLLRALQQREIERLGGTRTIQVDVRVIAATNMRPAPGDPGRARSARISTTGCTWCRSACLRCASGSRTCPTSPRTSCGSTPGSSRRTCAGSRAGRAWPSPTTTGRGTCASSRTSSSAAWRWPRAR